MNASTETRRPTLTFRIGITGAARLPSARSKAFGHLRAQIDDILARTHGQFDQLLGNARVRACYDLRARPQLRCLSPLGEGADRLFARAVLDLAAQDLAGPAICLDVITPFDRAAYEATFSPDDQKEHTASVSAFRTLIAEAQGRVLELDGNGPSDIVRPLSYEAVGHTIVRNADLMIAVWDETAAAKGRGGTRDTVHYALQAGVPVWLIDAAGKAPPQFLTDPLDFWRARADPSGADAALERYIANVVAPPEAEAGRRDPLLVYYDEPLRACRNICLVHQRSMRHLRGTQKNKGTAFIWLWGAAARAAFNHRRHPAAELAQAYQNRYRSSYLIVFVAAAVALISAIVGIVVSEIETLTTGVELVALTVVVSLVVLNHRDRWHERYVAYRMIAELARSAPHLHALGWSLPFNRMRRAAGGKPDEWIAWLAAAHARCEPLSTGVLKQALPSIRADIATLLTAQIGFHHDRQHECHLAGTRLERYGLWLFIATMAAVLMKGVALFLGADFLIGCCGEIPEWVENETVIQILAAFAAALPALSAAAFGIKAYEEFERLSELSKQTIADLDRCQERIGSIDIERPLASQIVAAEMFEAATIMLGEASGWAQLFRMKIVDA